MQNASASIIEHYTTAIPSQKEKFCYQTLKPFLHGALISLNFGFFINTPDFRRAAIILFLPSVCSSHLYMHITLFFLALDIILSSGSISSLTLPSLYNSINSNLQNPPPIFFHIFHYTIVARVCQLFFINVFKSFSFVTIHS